MRTVEEQQLRQLRLIHSQLNPGPALGKFFLWTCAFLLLVFGSFGLMVQVARAPLIHSPKVHDVLKGGSAQRRTQQESR